MHKIRDKSMISKIFFPTILNVVLVKLVSTSFNGVVNRVHVGYDGSFSKTIDKFTNPYHVSDFCRQKNAKCSNVINCEKCECKAEDTFVSYRDGCMDFNSSIYHLNGEFQTFY